MAVNLRLRELSMKRFFMLSATVVLCSILTGCGSESYEGLVSATINLIDQAGTDVGAIKNKVAEAVKNLDENKVKSLDLKPAIKAADALKKTGETAQDIKRKIEHIREKVTEEERKAYAAQQKNRLNDVFRRLLDQREQLRKELDAAEAVDNGKYKAAVADLRKKITDAESPFEAMARP